MKDIKRLGKIGKVFDESLVQSYEYLIEEKYDLAIAAIDKVICRIYKLGIDSNSEEERNSSTVIIIQLRAMIDYFNLAIKTSDDSWGTNHEEIEEIWELLCDCLERLEYCSRYFKAGFTNYILERLEPLLEAFKESLGDGVYASVEILSQSQICNICDLDVRQCTHIERELYNGSICRYQFNRPEVRGISIVESPKDPRCRMWPWNREEGNKFTMRFASFDDVFSFLDELNENCLQQA